LPEAPHLDALQGPVYCADARAASATTISDEICILFGLGSGYQAFLSLRLLSDRRIVVAGEQRGAGLSRVVDLSWFYLGFGDCSFLIRELLVRNGTEAKGPVRWRVS